MVVPSGEGYWKQRYIDRVRETTHDKRVKTTTVSDYVCFQMLFLFLVLAVDKDGHISKRDRWLYIPVSHQRLTTGSCR